MVWCLHKNRNDFAWYQASSTKWLRTLNSMGQHTIETYSPPTLFPIYTLHFGASGFLLDSWTLRMGPINWPETPLRNYHYSPRNDPEESSSQGQLYFKWNLRLHETFSATLDYFNFLFCDSFLDLNLSYHNPINLYAPCILYIGQTYRYSPEYSFYILSTNIFNFFFLDFLSPSSFIPPQNVVYFLMLPFLFYEIFIFYINGVLNCKCPAPGPKGNMNTKSGQFRGKI